MKATLATTISALVAVLSVLSATSGVSAKKAHSCRSPSRSHHARASAALAAASISTSSAPTAIKKVSKKHKSKSNSTIAGSAKLMKIAGSGATLKISKVSGPNGAESFINRGLSKTSPDSPWKPPKITIDQIVRAKLDDFTETTFKNCKPFLGLFKTAAKKYNLDPIMIAAFAMEESSCDPSSSGDAGGAHGLMQLVGENCNGAPNGNCADNDFNVDQGAKYFRQQLDSFDGDFLLALGSYNGWQEGLTFAQATAAANSGCCDCQQNLDYLYQHLNGWYMGGDGHDLATFDNLSVCGN